MPAPESAASPDPSVLHGSWQLERWEIAYSDGRPHTLPFGPDATGLIVYTQDGCMSACIARAGRAVLSGQSTRTVPAHEQAAAFDQRLILHIAPAVARAAMESGVARRPPNTR